MLLHLGNENLFVGCDVTLATHGHTPSSLTPVMLVELKEY